MKKTMLLLADAVAIMPARRLGAFFLPFFLLLASAVYADTYSVEVGKTATIYNTASAPAGTITNVFFSLADAADAEYLAIQYNSSDHKATVYGLKAKANIKVEVTYAYSYRGSYDGNMHVGHGTYYHYVTVKGGVTPTAISITPKDPQMYVGDTLELSAVLTPSNASTSYTWGTISGISTYGAFSLSCIGPKATVVAKKKGTLYVVAETANGLQAFCTIKAVDSDIEPTAISMNNTELDIAVGSSKRLKYTLTPSYASTDVTWSSSNENIATVNSSGRVDGVSSGRATITATTANGLSTSATVNVRPTPSAVSLVQSQTLYPGYSLALQPSFYPTDAMTTCKWSSSDTSVATVDANGSVTPKSTGTATVTVTTSENLTATCQITVQNAPTGLDYRNANVRIEAIKKLANESLENNR